MTLLNPPTPPQEFVLDEGGHCVFRINERKGASIVEKDGKRRARCMRFPNRNWLRSSNGRPTFTVNHDRRQ